MKIQKIGYGMGKKDFPEANCLRAFFGEMQDEKNTVTGLVTSIDGMTAEEISYACDVLRKAGALDVFTSSIYMKKRPGTLFTALCRNEQAEEMTELMFQHLSTIGIRRYETERVCLKRHEETVQDGSKTIRLKVSEGYGTVRSNYEYDDLVRVAEKKGRSLAEIREEVRNGMKK